MGLLDREQEIKSILVNDSTLMSILTGGVYTFLPEGISRVSTPNAYDASGYIKPCAMIWTGRIVREGSQYLDDLNLTYLAPYVQSIMIFVYQDRGYDKIDAAIQRIKKLLVGYQFSGAFPLEYVGVFPRELDVFGASLFVHVARVEFLLRGVERQV